MAERPPWRFLSHSSETKAFRALSCQALDKRNFYSAPKRSFSAFIFFTSVILHDWVKNKLLLF